MKSLFKPGDQKSFARIVVPEDQAIFNGELLHEVYSTFALARDFEWSSRLFFIDLKDEDEEGVGTFVQIDHLAPAFVGEEVTVTATVEEIHGMELVCSIEARVGIRLIAKGRTGQTMLKQDRLRKIFTKPA
ncbi:MAG: hypothetical protein JST14_17085 [Bacteroidetes bacterium]|nr:hypothetical protein [Bacteroidota bacterium]